WGGGLGGGLGPRQPPGPAAVVDDDLLAPPFAHLLGNGARKDIRRAARRIRHDQAHCPGGIRRSRGFVSCNRRRWKPARARKDENEQPGAQLPGPSGTLHPASGRWTLRPSLLEMCTASVKAR